MTASTKQDDQASISDKYLDDDFGLWIQSLMDEFHVPGMSVAVIRDGQVEATGYGLARLPDVPATADTIYTFGSTTKAFTATLMGLLIEDSANDKASEPSKLTWKTPVKSILKDDFVTTDPYVTDHASIEDLLSHRAGLPGHDLIWGPWLEIPSNITRLIRHLAFSESFRTRAQYNNIMFAIIGDAIEQITGEDFGTAVKKRIFEPLGMNKTFMGPVALEEAVKADREGDLQCARGYFWVDESSSESKDSTSKGQSKGYYVADPHVDINPCDAAGANVSTVRDYAKWVLALLKSSVKPRDATKSSNDNVIEDASNNSSEKPLISHDFWKELTTPRSFWLPVAIFNQDLLPERPNAQVNVLTYALGWMNDPYTFPGEVIVQHSGGIPCFSALVYMVPNHNFAIVAAGNTMGTSNQIIDLMVKELVGRRLGMSKHERRRRFNKEKKYKEEPEILGPTKAEAPHYNATELDFAHKSLNLTSKPTSPSDEPDTATFYLSNHPVHLPKLFTNPAYGLYNVTIAPQTLALSHPTPSDNNTPVIRTNPKTTNPPSPSDSNTNTAIEQHAHTIRISPVHLHSLKIELWLHPSAVQDDKIIYDVEQLMRHGPLDPERGDIDPFPSLLAGCGVEGDEEYPFRDMRVWVSESIKINGGVLVLREEEGSGEVGGKVYVVEKLGLRLARVDESKDLKNGVLEEGWNARMEWFVPKTE